MNTVSQALPQSEPVERTATGCGYLFGSLRDALLLWGATLVVLPVLWALPAEPYALGVGALGALLAHVINHPHFAHSYQLFYRDYRAKLLSPAYTRSLRSRYLFAGLLAPAALVVFLAWCITQGDVRRLGYAANLMFLLVGWHYVKQGYGILMLDAALKKRFFDGWEKKVLLFNAYAVWLTAWVQINQVLAAKHYFGIQYFTFAVPAPLGLLTKLAAVAGLCLFIWTCIRAASRHHLQLPWNGLMAYGVSLYAWTLFVRIDPLWLLLVPALHSLQYLAVVWRYELNYETGRSRGQAAGKQMSAWLAPENLRGRIMGFAILGLALGYAGFWAIPGLLQQNVGYSKELLGGSVFFFACWIFINVHHYLMDNVMWRRDNPDMRRYLFC
jgi:hypothetical protein